jgi:hypothetical protein
MSFNNTIFELLDNLKGSDPMSTDNRFIIHKSICELLQNMQGVEDKDWIVDRDAIHNQNPDLKQEFVALNAESAMATLYQKPSWDGWKDLNSRMDEHNRKVQYLLENPKP